MLRTLLTLYFNFNDSETLMASKASLEKLKFCNFKLDTLLAVTQSINNNEPVGGLLRRYERLLHDDLHIPNIILYSHDQNWQVLLVSGIGEELFDKIHAEQDLSQFTHISTTNYEKNPHLSRFDMIIPVFHKSKAIAYLLVGDSEEHPGMSHSIKHLQFIQTMTNVILVAIENKRLAKEQTKQASFLHDMDIAARMQKLLIPENKDLPRDEHITVAGFYQPHLYVGGDFYDLIQFNDHEYGFAIADVTGKGVSAALLMSNLQASMRALFTVEADLPTLVQQLNQKVLDIAGGDRFITMFIARYNAQTKELLYVNCGHEPSLFITVEREIEYLTEGCVGLGMLDEIPAMVMGQRTLEGDARLLCYTDGLIELKDGNEVKDNSLFIENLAKESESLDEMVTALVKLVGQSKSNDLLFDDISLLAVEFSAQSK